MVSELEEGVLEEMMFPFPTHINVSSFVSTRLTDQNYLGWKIQFQALLKGQKLLGFVDGSLLPPDEKVRVKCDGVITEVSNPDFESWLQTDQLVQSWIYGTLSEEVLGYAFGLNTAHEVWVMLAENFNQDSMSREFDLLGALQTMTKGNKDLKVYLREFKGVCDQLCSIGKPITESMKIYRLLQSLGKEYESFTTSIQTSMHKPPIPTYNEVVSQLVGFDGRIQSYSSLSINPQMAFQTQNTASDGGYLSSEGNFTNQSRPNYSSQSNFGYRGRGFRGGYRGRGGYSSRGRGFTQQVNTWNSQNTSQPSLRGSVCQICGRPGHLAIKCWNRFDTTYQCDDVPQALAVVHMSSNASHQSWYPDSGATSHITNSPSHLNEAASYSGSENVMMADGSFLPITHVGSTSLSSVSGSLPLRDVLVCPQIQKPLLSISKLCDDYPCGVYFDSNRVCVVDKNTQRVLKQGRRNENLYMLEDTGAVAFYSSRQQVVSDDVWHRRLGHPNSQILQLLKKNNAIVSNKASASSLCGPCQMGKSSQLPFSDSVFHALEPLERIHFDLWGPAPYDSVQGFRFYAIFVDNYSRFCWFYPLRFKSDFYSTFVTFKTLVEKQFDKMIKVFQSDGGGEFTNLRMKNYLADHGIHHYLSCPYTPQQNGLAERKHRHITELGLSMIFTGMVPFSYWVEAFYTANYLINLLPSQSLQSRSPFEILLGTKPSYTALRTFGCAAYPCLRPYASNKFDPRSLQCVFLGYNTQYKGYRCLHIASGRLYISRNVIFDENCFPFQDVSTSSGSVSTNLVNAWYKSSSSVHVPTVPPSRSLPDHTTSASSSASVYVPHVPEEMSPTSEQVCTGRTASLDLVPIGDSASVLSIGSDISSSPLTSDVVGSSSTSVSDSVAPLVSDTAVSSTSVHPMVTRGKLGITKPNPRYVLFTSTSLPEEPKTVAAALAHPGWKRAMEEEMESIYVNHTYDLVPHSSSMNLIGCKWVFKVKLQADGSLDKLKARLVAKGFLQEEGIDFIETYSPVVKTATVRIVLSVATAKKWSITQLDVKNAFLHGDLNEDVFMIQPPGFENSQKSTHVCHLKKALYGLKQAPRAWFDKFSNCLLEFGFRCSNSDPSMFVYHHGDKTLILLLYVDDILLTGSCSVLLKNLLQALDKSFSMKNLGSLGYFLGVQARFHPNGLFLHQSKYSEEILSAAGMASCRPVPTPLPLQLDSTIADNNPFPEPSYFRCLAGKLQYLTLTRPDLQFAVNVVCQRMHAPTVGDFSLLKRVLRYVRGTSTLGLNLSSDSNLTLMAFSDSDWAGCKLTRRSTTGYCTFLGPHLVSWSAKKQPTVSRSSTEAEYRALAETTAELTWISSVLRDLGVSQHGPARLLCDNLSAVHLTANPKFHSRSKHIDIDYHFTREKVTLGVIETCHISAQFQLADIFTKSLPKADFVSLRGKLGVCVPPPTSLRGDVEKKSMLSFEDVEKKNTLVCETNEVKQVEMGCVELAHKEANNIEVTKSKSHKEDSCELTREEKIPAKMQSRTTLSYRDVVCGKKSEYGQVSNYDCSNKRMKKDTVL